MIPMGLATASSLLALLLCIATVSPFFLSSPTPVFLCRLRSPRVSSVTSPLPPLQAYEKYGRPSYRSTPSRSSSDLPSKRQLRFAQEVQSTLSSILLHRPTKIKHPTGNGGRVLPTSLLSLISVVSVRVDADLRGATVEVSVLDAENSTAVSEDARLLDDDYGNSAVGDDEDDEDEDDDGDDDDDDDDEEVPDLDIDAYFTTTEADADVLDPPSSLPFRRPPRLSSRRLVLPTASHELTRRKVFTWLARNAPQISHALTTELRHLKRVPKVRFKLLNAGAAVDAMHAIDLLDGGEGGEGEGDDELKLENDEDDEDWEDEEDDEGRDDGRNYKRSNR